MTHLGTVGESIVSSSSSSRFSFCWLQNHQAEVCWEGAQPLSERLAAPWWNREMWIINSLPSGSLFSDACLLIEPCDTVPILCWRHLLPPTVKVKNNVLFLKVDISDWSQWTEREAKIKLNARDFMVCVCHIKRLPQPSNSMSWYKVSHLK